MESLQFFDVLDKTTLEQCIADYNARNEYDTLDMNKATPGLSLSLLQPHVEHCLNKNLIFCNGNFYKHNTPYLPHTDFRVRQNNYINVVIPLNYTDSLPYLVIFDQTWDKNSVTWCMQYGVLDYKVNTGVSGYPGQYDIGHCTNRDIDLDFYSKYLDHYSKDMLWGLSGNVYPFTPGSIICFNNKRIHCTSKFTGTKLGISLRFKEYHID